jgi:ATP-binding cassette subfamily E protein 1
VRVAVLEQKRCKTKDCGRECIKFCPVVRTGVDCIYLKEGVMKYPHLVESLCTGCGICIKKCPFKALSIVNLPEELKTDATYRYGKDTFVLFRLPPLIPGKIVGIIGPNGAGKTTALKILSGEIKLNLGNYENPPEWEEIIKYFRGSELQAYFQQLSEKQLRVIAKPQYIAELPNIISGRVCDLLEKVDEKGLLKEVKEKLNLTKFWDRDVKVLSGGELQRVSIAAAYLRDRDVYLFDEPSSFLDVRERLEMAKLIRQLAEKENKIVGVVEHDLTICDYITDFVCILYGVPGVYGIVSHVHNTNAGLNLYLHGELPDENIRFRDEPITFSIIPEATEGWSGSEKILEYPELSKTLGDFTLKIAPGIIKRGEVIGLVGRNGLGKTTLLTLLSDYAKEQEVTLIEKIEKPKPEKEPESKQTPENQPGKAEKEQPVKEQPDKVKPEKQSKSPEKPVKDKVKAPTVEIRKTKLKVAIKPQHLIASYDGTVEQLLKDIAGKTFHTSIYRSEIIKPFGLENVLDHYIKELSGGELQKAYIAETLSHMDANLIFMDEPSAFLDSESRLVITKSIKRIIKNRKISAFIVEHDILCVDFLSDSLIVFSGEPGKRGFATAPVNLRYGMNQFLKDVEVTFRRDAKSFRPRVNKMGSELDRKQKAIGEYYFIDIKK